MRKGIAIAGTITIDNIKKVVKYPNESELTAIKSVKKSLGGAVSNCSIGLSKLDHTVPIEIIALIGNDENGTYIKEHFKEYSNIDTSRLKTAGLTPYTDVMQNINNNTRTFFTFKGNSYLFDEEAINLYSINSKILHIAYILLLDALDKKDDKYGTKMAKVLKKAQELGIKTSIDVISEASNRYSEIVPPSLVYTNYCIINEVEAGKTVNIELRNNVGGLLTHKIRDVLLKLKEIGVKDWVIIHVLEGSFGFDGVQMISIPSLYVEKSKIKGTVGAGDAYVSGILYGAEKDWSLLTSMKLATASAASSLLQEDSTSGIKSSNELINMFDMYPKNKTFDIQ